MHNKNQPRPKLKRLFNSRLEDKKLTLISENELNDASWGAWFGQIQQALREKSWNGSAFNHCIVDMTPCKWADPLPLMSLSISLAEFEQTGGSVSLVFPPDNLNNDDHLRFLKFMAREGFISLFHQPIIVDLPSKTENRSIKNREVKIGDKEITHQLLDDLKEKNVAIAFERSTCLPVTLLYLECPNDSNHSKVFDDIDQWVERRFHEAIEPVVSAMVPGWAQRSIRYRLLTVLREMLHNVAEHAYDKSGNMSGFAAVYVRYREGALGEAPENWGRLQSFIKREHDQNKVPLMTPPSEHEFFPKTRTGFFELYVLDSGTGLCSSFNDHSEQISENSLHKYMLEIFDNGRRRKEKHSTKNGGLFLIRNLLEPMHDYLRIRDEDEWWGTELPLKRTEHGSTIKGQFTLSACGKEHTKNTIEGVAWTVRLSWLDKTDLVGFEGPWQGLIEDNDRIYRKALLRVLGADNDATLFSLEDIAIVDCRFPSQKWDNADKFSGKSAKIVLLLPQAGWTKNHIHHEIKESVITGNLVRNGSFIIGDIPSEEAVTYLAAIERSHMFTKDPLANINRVVLVTCELKVCVFERGKDHLLVITKYESIIFIKNRADSIAPDKDLMQYFSLLRYHDGFRLWEIVQSQGDAYLDKKVKWNEAITLNGYLDFPQSLTYPVCRGIYTHTLQRLTGLFPPHECTLVGLDGLVDSLVVRFNAEQHPRYRGKIGEFNPIRLCIGSVQVSGLTEQFGREKGKVFFHFFRHPSGTAKGLYLLPWMAKAISEHSDPNYRYERVGRTPVVAQDGWKAYRMPRFNSEGKPIYEQAPRESYRAWQEPSRTPLMIGHWNYGGHHDLLTLNLLLAFDTELDRISLALEGSMARFVYANFFRLFKLDNTQLNQRGKELFKADQNDQYLKLLPNYLSEENALLLYPSHPVTDHIMDRFLSLVADKIHQGEQSSPLDRVRSRLIAVLPIRRYRSGSGLQISGLVLKRLQDIPSPKPPVVIFDDALISGRTYSDLKRLLRSIGFKKICSLILVDRQRFASADHVESENHLCYWRLDLPSLGSEHNCPLCQARRRVGDLANHLTNPEYCKRIESWRDSWRPLNPATQWGDGGLRPIPLFLKKPERKFSIEPIPDKLGSYQQIGGDKKQIKITNSAGLAAYVSELHSITSHDDLALRILKNNESLSSEIRIQLLSSQILLFSGEFDRDLAKDLGYELMKALWDAKSHDRHTALAVLTLVGGGNAFLKQVIISFFAEESRRQRVVNCNIDIILLLVLMLFIEKSTAQPDPSLLWLNELNILWGILKTRNRTELCGWLHRVVRDCAGKQHSTPLHRFKNSLSEDFNSESINKILYSARQLQSIIDSVERHWLRTDSEGHREYEAIQKEMKQSTETIVMKLTQLSNNLDGMTKILAKEHMTEARSLVEKLLNEAEKIHDCVFTPIGISRLKSEVENSDSLLLEKLQRMQTGMDDKKIAWYKPTPYDKQRHLALINKPEMFEVYIPWDACLVTAIQDILTNIRHAIKEITNPWKTDNKLNTGNNESAHLWGRLRFEKLEVIIELCNAANNPQEDSEKFNKSLSFIRAQLTDSGCRATCRPDTEGNVLTCISIPYAHTLRATTEESNNG